MLVHTFPPSTCPTNGRYKTKACCFTVQVGQRRSSRLLPKPKFSKHFLKNMSHMGGGHRTPSLMGSKQSVYSHSSSAVRTFRSGPKSHKSHKSVQKWYMKPIMKSAIYTDLQRGAWHIAFYILVSLPLRFLFRVERPRGLREALSELCLFERSETNVATRVY